MPLILRHGSGQMSGCKSASRTMLMPLGLLNSLAILASSLLGATPMEQVRPVASKMLFCSSRASTRPPSRWPPGTWVKSMNTSSMPQSCMTGAISRITASNDIKFSSGKLKLEQGRHIKEGDVHKALIHETFAKQNNVKIGDYITVRGNEKDYDNVKKVKKKIKLQVVGIFSGKSSDHAVYSGDLAENLIISDISTARELYGYTEKSEIYMDATFLTKGSKNVEELMDKIQELDIDWRMYQMSRSGDMLLGMSGAISGIYKLVKVVMIAAMVISAAVLILILLLWLGERKKETAIFMSLGYSKLKIVLQYIVELIVILTMSTCIAFFIAKSVAQPLGDKLLSKSVSNFASEMNNGQGNMGADLDTSIATQTPQKIDVEMKTGDILRVIAIGSGVVLISVLISSVPMIRRKPKDLLSHFE